AHVRRQLLPLRQLTELEERTRIVCRPCKTRQCEQQDDRDPPSVCHEERACRSRRAHAGPSRGLASASWALACTDCSTALRLDSTTRNRCRSISTRCTRVSSDRLRVSRTLSWAAARTFPGIGTTRLSSSITAAPVASTSGNAQTKRHSAFIAPP